MTIHPGQSDTVTEGIRVRVGAQLVPEQSDPSIGCWTYAYRVILHNEGSESAKLRTRHWVITDAEGDVREVRGPGVVGEFPDLAPGEVFRYQSGSQLPTEWGTMEGSYFFERPDGRSFEVEVGRFFLAPNVPPLSTLDEPIEPATR